MPRLALILAFGLALAWLCPQAGLAQPADDLDAATMAADEYEALVTALDEFGLDLDSPEFDEMDEGEVWGYIERRRREGDAGVDQPSRAVRKERWPGQDDR